MSGGMRDERRRPLSRSASDGGDWMGEARGDKSDGVYVLLLSRSGSSIAADGLSQSVSITVAIKWSVSAPWAGWGSLPLLSVSESG